MFLVFSENRDRPVSSVFVWRSVSEFLDPVSVKTSPIRSFFSHWKRAFWASFCESWVYKFGHRCNWMRRGPTGNSICLYGYPRSFLLSLKTGSTPPPLSPLYYYNRMSIFFTYLLLLRGRLLSQSLISGIWVDRRWPCLFTLPLDDTQNNFLFLVDSGALLSILSPTVSQDHSLSWRLRRNRIK